MASPRTKKGLVWTLPLGLILTLIIIVPLGYIVIGGFQDNTLTGGISNWTLGPVTEVLTSSSYIDALVATVVISVAVSVVAVLVAIIMAWLITRTDMPGKTASELIVVAPMLLSPFIGAVAWLTLGSPRAGLINNVGTQYLGLDGPMIDIMTTRGVIFVLALYYVPYAYVFIASGLRKMNPALEEASALSGRGKLGTLVHVTLPLMKPAIGASFLFIIVLTASIFSVPGVLGGNMTPLAVLIQRELSVFPTNYSRAAAASILLLALTAIGIFLYRRMTRNSERFVTVTGGGGRPKLMNLGRSRRVLAVALFVIYGLLSVILPYLGLFLIAFVEGSSITLDSLSFSFGPFLDTVTSNAVVEATLNTIVVGVASATGCVVLGLALAYAIQRVKAPFGGGLDYVATIPIAVSGLVLGVGMIWAYVSTPLYGTLWIIAAAFLINYLPQGYRLVSNGLVQTDKSLEEASSLSGSSRLRTLGRVTVPLLRSPLLAAWALCFLFATREISSAIVLYGPDTYVLSVLVWDFTQFGDLKAGATVSLIQSVFLVVMLLLARYVLKVKLSGVGG